MVHTLTRYTANLSFKGISLSDCDIDGIPLPVLLMSDEHHKDKCVKWHCIDSLQLGSRDGSRCWAQCDTRHMNEFEAWLHNDLQKAAYRFLTKDPDDRDSCAFSVAIISSDTSRREGPLLLPRPRATYPPKICHRSTVHLRHSRRQ